MPKSLRYIFLFISIVYSGSILFAQNHTLDSLKKDLEKISSKPKSFGNDTCKVVTLINISRELKSNEDLDGAEKIAKSALVISQEIKFLKGLATCHNSLGLINYYKNDYPEALNNYRASLQYSIQGGDKKGMAISHNNLGMIYTQQGNYTEAIESYFASLKIKEEISDRNGMSASYNNIGITYYNQGNYPLALKNYFASLKIREEIGDKKDIAASYNNIGQIYWSQENYEEALKNFNISLKLKKEINDNRGIASTYNNIGNIYYNQEKFEKALENYQASFKIKEGIGDKEGIANSFNNIANVYIEQGDFTKALTSYQQALKIRIEIGDLNGLAYAYNGIGSIYIHTKKISKAKNYLDKALSLSLELGIKDQIREVYSHFTDLAYATGNYKQAFENYKNYILYRDSLVNEENSQKTMQVSMQYEFDKKSAADSVKNAEEQKVKDAQIFAQNAQIKQEKTQRYGLYGGLSLILVFAGFIYNRFKVTQKQKSIIEIQKTEVEKQKELADSRRIIAEEQREIITLKNTEIIDSINYAKRIQQAMLPSENYIQEELRKHQSEHFIFFKPKDIVSGDFYWFYNHENKLYYMTADCTGHGVPGGFMSMLGINLLNEIVIERGITDPGLILDKLREEIIKALTTEEGFAKDGMDGVLCKIDYANNKLEYATSNNPFYILRNKEILKQSAQKIPIGFADNQVPFVTKTFHLNQGDIIYTFTDGYADQFGGEKGKKFLYKQFEGKIVTISDLSFEEQKETLSKAFDDWKGKLEQVDDVCVIGIQI